MKLKVFCIILFLLTSACEKFVSDPKAKNKNFGIEVIYGEDDRIDWFQEKDENWQDLALSTVALFDKRSVLEIDSGGVYELKTKPYGLSKTLCMDEAFYEQEMGSFCSGFLIGPDLVVTAGHCLRNSFGCQNVRFIFDYYYALADLSPKTVTAKSVYLCKEIIHTQANALTGSDFALVRLDRPVDDRRPLQIRTTGDLKPTDPLTVVGYPSGLPVKLAHSGKIRDLQNPAFIVASLDTYGGNSGSAVFNSQSRLVEGLLVNGDTDFVFDPVRRCRVSNVCKETECRGEDITRISEILPYLTPQDVNN